jgi:putative phosphoribosyl transferase
VIAVRLADHRGEDLVVLGLPRGGVPVAYEIARALAAPLDVIVVRKLGVPFQPELAMGAIGEGGVRIVNEGLLRRGGLSEDDLAEVEEIERAELAARVERLRHGRPPVSLSGRTAVIVDDGAATGATARAACQVARAQGAKRVVLALPVAAPEVALDLGEVADEVICLRTPVGFQAVGQWYLDFTQTTDREVDSLLPGFSC